MGRAGTRASGVSLKRPVVYLTNGRQQVYDVKNGRAGGRKKEGCVIMAQEGISDSPLGNCDERRALSRGILASSTA